MWTFIKSKLRFLLYLFHFISVTLIPLHMQKLNNASSYQLQFFKYKIFATAVMSFHLLQSTCNWYHFTVSFINFLCFFWLAPVQPPVNSETITCTTVNSCSYLYCSVTSDKWCLWLFFSMYMYVVQRSISWRYCLRESVCNINVYRSDQYFMMCGRANAALFFSCKLYTYWFMKVPVYFSVGFCDKVQTLDDWWTDSYRNYLVC